MIKSEHFPESFYRVSVRGLMRDGDKFLLGRHNVEAGTWETFGGGLDFGEKPDEALRREIREELGCEVNHISEKPLLVLPHKVHNKRGLDWFYNLPIYYEIKFDISEVDLSLQYAELRWFTIDEIQELTLFQGEEGIREGFKTLLGG